MISRIRGIRRAGPLLFVLWTGVVLGAVVAFGVNLISGAGPDANGVYLREHPRLVLTWLAFVLLLIVITGVWYWAKRTSLDDRLVAAATVKRADELRIGTDIVIVNHVPGRHVTREVDDAAHKAFDDRNAVVFIVGRPGSGKTQLAWTLLSQRQQALVVMPLDDTPPSDIPAHGLAGRDVVLFFDDLHQTAERTRLLLWWKRLGGATGRGCRLLCTARDGADWARVKENQADLLYTLGPEATFVYTAEVDGQGRNFTTAEGQKLAEDLHLTPQQFKDLFDGTPGSLTLGLEAMKARYEALTDDWIGGVRASRFLDAAKLLHTARQPRLREAMLKQVAEQVRGDRILSPEEWDSLLRRTQQSGFGRLDRREYRFYRPHLEQCVTYEPTSEECARLLPLLQAANDTDGLFYLGVALHDRKPDVAEAAYSIAVGGGILAAAVNLGNLLAEQPGRAAEAEQLYRQELAGGHLKASFNLGNLLAEQPGREVEAEQLYRQALAGGDLDAAVNLGLLLAEQPGREAEEIEQFQIAISKTPAGPIPAAYLAGLLLAIDADHGAAALARAFHLAAETPVPGLLLGLWFYRLIHGPPAERREAVQALRQRLESGERAPGWNLRRNVAWAERHAHPDAEWLAPLSAAIADGADLDSLAPWPAWRDAKPDD